MAVCPAYRVLLLQGSTVKTTVKKFLTLYAIMCQGVFLLRDPYDGLPLIGNIHLVLGPEEGFSKKGISDFELTTLK